MNEKIDKTKQKRKNCANWESDFIKWFDFMPSPCTVVWTAIDSIAENFFFSTGTNYRILNKCLHGAFASECSGLCFNY